MAKYKKITENIVDNLIGSIFSTIGKGVKSVALKHLSNKDPEFKKKIQKAEKARNDLESYLRSKGVPELSKAEKRAADRGEYFK
tara:strand:+ start:83 stop:334 length:252 start_codon:yes stop_codon:yes gene_type:complete